MKNYDLSYESLTGMQARNHLQNLKTTDPEFWSELTSSDKDELVVNMANNKIPEDNEELPDDGLDDSDISCAAVINQSLNPVTIEPDALAVTESGGLSSSAATETFEGEFVEDDEANMGRGKCQKIKNWLYTSPFWQYN